MTNILLIGNGAREHAIAKQVIRSGGTLFTIMDKLNPGIARLSKKYVIGELSDLSSLSSFDKIDIAIIGPEKPLAEGIVDELQEKYNIPSVGPSKQAAQLESSKIYMRSIVEKAYSPANPVYYVCKSKEEILEGLKKLDYKVAVKPDTLTGGKGVKISGVHLATNKEMIAYAEEWLQKDEVVLLEEMLVGKEFTLQAFVDGEHVAFMPLVKDYKRAYDGDKGPNTGSMGAVSCSSHNLPFLNDVSLQEAKKIVIKTVSYLRETLHTPYKGVLYGQFMLTESNEVKLIEFNVRFGDPEAINVMSLLETNYIDICNQIITGTLKAVLFAQEASVIVYIVPKGYPDKPQKDQELELPENLVDEVYYASVYSKDENKPTIIYTTGSRALGVLARAKDINTAHLLAMEKIVTIKGTVDYRKDIGYDIHC